MVDRNGRKPPLVADRRYAGKSGGGKRAAPAKKPTPAKTKAPARRSRTRSARPRRGSGGPVRRILGFFGAILAGILGLIWAAGWRMAMVVGLLIALAVGYFYTTLPEVDALLDGRARGSVTMLDVNGDVFAWRGDQFGGVVTADTVSPHLKNAIIATEDKRFYSHFGVSPRGVASAVRINLREGRGPLSGHGGSTITQQTAKLLCLGEPFDPAAGISEADYEAECRRGTLWRKIKEAVFSMAMEAKYTKDEILTIYMNRAFLGAGARGFEAASQRYFGKSAAEVSPAEAAMLAGLLVAPTRFAPTNDLDRAQNRASLIVGLMEEQGFLTADQAAEARANPAELSEAAEEKAGGYFADWVMSSGPEYFTRNTTEDVIIRTTLERNLQKSAEEALRYIFAEKVRDGFQGAGRDRGDVRGRRGARHGRRAQDQGGGGLQPRHPGAAPDRIGVQALRLCHGAGTGLFSAGHGGGRALLHDDPRLGPVVSQELHQQIQWPGDADRCAEGFAEHPGGQGLREGRARSGANRRRRLRHRERPGAGAGAGAGGVGKHPDRDDRRLCGHSQRRLVGHALRAGRIAASGRRRRR